jgi:hypothetical protein
MVREGARQKVKAVTAKLTINILEEQLLVSVLTATKIRLLMALKVFFKLTVLNPTEAEKDSSRQQELRCSGSS